MTQHRLQHGRDASAENPDSFFGARVTTTAHDRPGAIRERSFSFLSHTTGLGCELPPAHKADTGRREEAAMEHTSTGRTAVQGCQWTAPYQRRSEATDGSHSARKSPALLRSNRRAATFVFARAQNDFQRLSWCGPVCSVPRPVRAGQRKIPWVRAEFFQRSEQ